MRTLDWKKHIGGYQGEDAAIGQGDYSWGDFEDHEIEQMERDRERDYKARDQRKEMDDKISSLEKQVAANKTAAAQKPAPAPAPKPEPKQPAAPVENPLDNMREKYDPYEFNKTVKNRGGDADADKEASIASAKEKSQAFKTAPTTGNEQNAQSFMDDYKLKLTS